MYGALVMGRSRLTIEVVAGEPDAEHGDASELKGYWLVVTETDADGEDGLEVRVAVDPTTAELLVASWREHLASCGREVTDETLRELMDRDDGDATARVVTPIRGGNRRERRAARHGDGLAAQDSAAARAARDFKKGER